MNRWRKRDNDKTKKIENHHKQEISVLRLTRDTPIRSQYPAIQGIVMFFSKQEVYVI